ncbi:MAG TPA: hypothetical protein VMA34_03440 [Terracidiphilus sp.]|nr:hypothetical protein [Terracidiphilus sp.]
MSSGGTVQVVVANEGPENPIAEKAMKRLLTFSGLIPRIIEGDLMALQSCVGATVTRASRSGEYTGVVAQIDPTKVERGSNVTVCSETS